MYRSNDDVARPSKTGAQLTPFECQSVCVLCVCSTYFYIHMRIRAISCNKHSLKQHKYNLHIVAPIIVSGNRVRTEASATAVVVVNKLKHTDTCGVCIYYTHYLYAYAACDGRMVSARLLRQFAVHHSGCTMVMNTIPPSARAPVLLLCIVRDYTSIIISVIGSSICVRRARMSHTSSYIHEADR